MPVSSVPDFLQLVRKSQLLNAEQWRRLQERASGAESAQQLADSLTDDGLLTAWQSNQLLKGQSGFVLEQYRLLNPIGRGGMGHVFRAKDDRDGQIVAVKVMARKLSNNAVLVNRFRREIKASSQLSSPHVVRAVDAGRVGNVDFMVMEYVNGDQLDWIADRIGVLPSGIACEIIRQAAVGLQHAHEQRMVHRDIKPSNLIVDWSEEGIGTVKIMDLGLVRLESEEAENNSVTRTGQVMGTPDYMSPEQAWDTAKADIRSDIYSLGCALYRLLTGQMPFPGDNPLQVLMARCSRDVPDVRIARSEITQELQQIVAKMTRRDPGSRYQTPGEVALALQALCEPLTQEALRVAARMSTGTADAADGWTGLAPESSPSDDAGYEQFLREMESGAAVDLMMSTSVSAVSTTQPDGPVSQIVSKRRTYAARGRKAKPRSRIWLIASAFIAMAVIIVAVSVPMSGGRGEGDREQHDDAQGTAEWIVPKVVFAEPEAVTVRAGETASVRLLYTITEKGSGGKLSATLADNAPPDATLDEKNGVVTWRPTSLVSPGRHAFNVNLKWNSDEQSATVAALPVEFIVQPGPLSLSLEQPDAVRMQVNQPLDLAINTTGFVVDDIGAAFRISSGGADGMSLDPASGKLHWVPSEDSVGRHEVRVELFDTSSGAALAGTTVRIMVIPSMLSLRLPEFPVQNVVAGERFELMLTSRQPQMLMRAIRLKLGDNAPPGAQLDADQQKFTWDIPVQQPAGRVEIELVAEPAGPRIEFAPDSRLSTNIVLDVQAAVVSTAMPAEAEVKTAEGELRELFRRELASARTPAARAELAASLLERSYEQPASASNFAMLNIAAELADRGNAFDVLPELELHRSQRYGTEEVPRVLPALARMRRNSLGGIQHELVVEHCLRLAAIATRSGQFADSQKLLDAANMIIRSSSDVDRGRQFVTDLNHAAELAETLAAAAGGSTNAVRTQELQRLLDSWQFVSLFDQRDTLSFLQNPSAATPLVNSGRDLWNFGEQRLLMESPPLDGLTGFIETTRRPTRYVIRLHVAPATNSLSLIVGGSSGGELAGYLLNLDNSGFAALQRLPGPTVVRKAPATVPLSSTFPNIVDVAGDGNQLTVRVNGSQILSARLPESVGGQIGLMSSLVRPAPGARVDIRRPRLLILPGED